MQRYHLAFRRSLERSSSYSQGTIRSYVSGAAALIRHCDEREIDMAKGAVPTTLLTDFAEHAPERRDQRGAALFVDFLRAQGIPLPVLRGPGSDRLELAQIERFEAAAARQPEPFATFFRLMPRTGLRAADLLPLELEHVERDGDAAITLAVPEGSLQLGDEARDLLVAYLDGWRAEHHEASAALFPGSSGAAPSPSTVTRRLKALQREAELPEFRVTALSAAYAVHFDPLAVVEVVDVMSMDGENETAPSEGAEAREEQAIGEEQLPPTAVPREAALAGPPAEEEGEVQDDRTKKKRASSEPRPSREVARALPRSGVVYIRKRQPDGKLGFVGTYNVTDFGEDQAIEPFLHRHILPAFGPGDYLVYSNPRTDRPLHVFTILAPIVSSASPAHEEPGRAPPSTVDTFREYLDAFQALTDRPQPGAAPTSPIEALHAMRRDDEIRRLREELDRLRREVGQPSSMLGGSGLPSMGPTLPPLTSPTDSMLETLLHQHLEASRRDRDLLIEVLKHQAGVKESGAAPDKLDRLFDVLSSPAAARALELAVAGRGRPPPPPSPHPPPRGRGRPVSGAAPQPSPRRAPESPPMPEQVVPYFEEMDRAETEEELLDAMTRACAVLHLDPAWGPSVRATLQAIAMDRREDAQRGLWSVLAPAVGAGLLEEETASAAIEVVDHAWDVLRGRVMDMIRRGAPADRDVS